MQFAELIAGYPAYKNYFAENRARLVELAHAQQPRVLWIGCPDSRVIPEKILNAQPGDVFVIRNIANIIPPNGTVNDTVGAVIEYAIYYLSIADIIICGHSECGGIRALEQSLNLAREPHLARWIEFARPALAQVQASGVNDAQRHFETVKANVLLQRNNLLTYDGVREALHAGKLRVHAWLYDVWTGDLQQFDDQLKQWRALDSQGS